MILKSLRQFSSLLDVHSAELSMCSGMHAEQAEPFEGSLSMTGKYVVIISS